MSGIVIGCVAIALVIGGAWIGSQLIRAGEAGWAVTTFLLACLDAGICTDNIR